MCLNLITSIKGVDINVERQEVESQGYRGLTGENEHAWQSPGACQPQRRPRQEATGIPPIRVETEYSRLPGFPFSTGYFAKWFFSETSLT